MCIRDRSGTWERPPDSGRSTNCLINAAGIFVHTLEQGHHNYAAPYSWDVRLGHKTRDEAMFELDDPMDDAELAAITTMLAEVGYEPRKPELLTLWVEADERLDIEALENELAANLPTHAVPQVIEVVDEIPLTTNGKVDFAALPAPAARRRGVVGESVGRAPESETEREIAAIWTSVLGVNNVAATEDFFAMGATSLHALEMIVRVSSHFDVVVPESVAFTERSVEALARYLDNELPSQAAAARADALRHGEPKIDRFEIAPLADGEQPLSAGEESLLYEWRRDPSDVRYNVARLYRLPPDMDVERFDAALTAVVAAQPTLHTSYGARRHQLDVSSALRIASSHSEIARLKHLADRLNGVPFDLVNGPLVTAHHLTTDHPEERGQRALLLRTHHIVSDAGSLDICLLYTSPSPRDRQKSRMPSSA